MPVHQAKKRKSLGKAICVIGDAEKPGPANKATEAALEAVLKL